MKVLWLTNILFPEANALLTGNSEFKSSGGWMLSLAQDLSTRKDIDLYVMTVSSDVKDLRILKGERITYYVIPWIRRGKKQYYADFFLKIKKDILPDVVHIHGTESPYGYYYTETCGSVNVVVSIQGVMKEIAKHCNEGLSFCNIISNLTLSDVVHRNSLFDIKRRFASYAHYEKLLLESINHIIGRTDFDKEFAYSINPNVYYHHCDESLRDEFYDGIWNYESCQPHSIFMSQCTYPVKGLHSALYAFASVRNKFKDLKIRIAGQDVRKTKSGYGKIIESEIQQLGLGDCILFLGSLNALEIKQELLDANVFLSSSTIENSPNSLGEAQILGVPSIASAVGGVPSMIRSDKEGLMYTYSDNNTLTNYICYLFENTEFFDNSIMINTASMRHNKTNNLTSVIDVYKEIIANEK